MIDHATEERRAWIARMQTGEKPQNWLLLAEYSPLPDPRVDAEYQARADRAWAKTRAIGGGHG